MVNHCVAFGCTNEYLRNHINFHRFPVNKPELLKKWVVAVRRENFKPTANSRICSAHFTTDDYRTSQRKYLKKDVVPTVFNFPSHLMKKPKPERRVLQRIIKTPVLENCPEASQSDPVLEFNASNSIGIQTDPMPPSRQQFLLKIKIIQQRLKRRDRRLRSLKDLISHLKKNGHSSNNLEDALNVHFEGFSLDLKDFKNEVRNTGVTKNHRHYSEKMKQFALTLYFYSPKAYNFVRNKLHLPHSSSIRKWLSSFKCKSGFLQEVFDFLQNEVTVRPQLQDVALIFDGMAIRSQIIFDKEADEYTGYVDFGGIMHTESEDMATEALVFQIVSFSTNFKCVVGYFFINKINATLQSQLVLTAIRKLHQVGITVRSVTCDGTATNVKTFENLGCVINSQRIISYFKHPCANVNVYAIMDPCHMLKLSRNTFAESSLSSSAGPISFNYIKSLHQLQEQEDLKFANALSASHVNFYNNKMKVRFAAQTLSSGVADALDFLKSTGHAKFQGSEATVELIRYIDRIFDIMNSRSPFAKGFKAPLRLQNQKYWSQILLDTEKYLKQLKVDGQFILKHPRKTFAIGFLLNISSFRLLSLDLLNKADNPMKYFLAYKCSQDHLELFFSCIRSRGGWNNNPNTLQFKWALRALLFRNSITSSVNANCTDLQTFECQPILEFRSNQRSLITDDSPSQDEAMNSITDLMEHDNLTSFQDNILYYIGGFVVRKLLSKINCNFCKNILIENPDSDHCYAVDINKYSAFTTFVSRGGLYLPSNAVFKILQYTEKLFRHQLKLGIAKRNNFLRNISLAVLQQFQHTIITLFKPAHPPVHDIFSEDLHEIQIIKQVVTIFCETRLQTYAKKATLRSLGNKATMRQKLHNSILFYGV